MTCKCGATYQAREADVKRGWGKSCSKSCAARKRASREARGNFNIAPASRKYAVESRPSRFGNDEDGSWDAHKF